MSNEFPGMILSVGARMPAPFDAIGGVGGLLDMNREGILIGTVVDNPRPQEIEAAAAEKMTIGLLQHRDALFFLLAIGKCLVFDLSYSVEKVAPDLRGLPERTPQAGLTFSLVFGDSVSKRIEALRFATTSPQFSRTLEAFVSKMEARLKQGSYDFEGSYQDALRKYPDPALMFKDAQITEIAGRPFTDIDHSMVRAFK